MKLIVGVNITKIFLTIANKCFQSYLKFASKTRRFLMHGSSRCSTQADSEKKSLMALTLCVNDGTIIETFVRKYLQTNLIFVS
jgi:hypothetical protein